MRVAIIDHAGLVITVVEVEEVEDYDPGNELIAVPDPENEVFAGCTWNEADGFTVPVAPPLTPAELDAHKSALKMQIDLAAELERLKYITAGAGQAMTYQQKMEEVRALAQDPEPEPANYPLLSSEIGITAPTLSEVAAAVLGAYQQWQIVGAAIERSRLGAKAEVDQADTLQEANAAAAVSWPNI